ncbi:translational GTPase TypA [Ferroacidibacillus organovorans]|uniref:Large ribosomal subunit assembly factor BipA n=1 Tax=Ferroacidibacillus organovorans TaxID=1765683 RepID=A0A162UM98_9BACL|nr:translational GTPase TypA [Ferroacidibacillus organovorans]KYP81873.1 GTP-binding protein TypA [Ferroacidibacillus organovorans]OAG94218.1 GTP-binding protein TypA [Ferroacidibacillus organovorans]OPG16267.1 GTP-binding protein TypA [Ferroacidibacillus organovorans]
MRNLAIIAHVDHGKTTLVDQMLRQSGVFRDNEHLVERVMDSNDLERERGITILAKNTAITYQDTLLNIVDTPGHADFSGEVERILKMVDGVLLVVDAFEGCMPQTKFVLRKALEQELKPVVVVNKIDRPMARPLEVVDEVLELFMELGANDEQINFPVVFASAIRGISTLDTEVEGTDFRPLFDTILETIPAPNVDEFAPLQWQASILDYNEFMGRIGIGRIARGKVQSGQTVVVLKADGTSVNQRISKLYGFQGLRRVEWAEAEAGDIVAIAGLGDLMVGDTVADVNFPEALPSLSIEEPSLQMTFSVNDSPFIGQDGQHVTSRKLRSRLYAELERDVSLRVEDTESPDSLLVSGRGELHLSILIETMRREGYEMQVSKPRVIFRRNEAGELLEPIEHLVIDVPEEYVGTVMEKLGSRRAEMVQMVPSDSNTRLEFYVPARGLIGFRNELLSATRGYGIMHHTYHGHEPYRGDIPERQNGVLVASEAGTSTAYAISSAEERGTLFIGPGAEIYEGMVIGENSRDQDLVVNVCREKHMSNVRSATKDDTVRLKTPRTLSLEEALEYLAEDELCEITPHFVRIRKRVLKKSDREKAQKMSSQRV